MSNTPTRPIATRRDGEPLPMRLASVDHLPHALRGQYTDITLQGDYELAWIHEGDTASSKAHLEAIAGGKVSIVPDGETPASLAQKQADREAAFNAALSEGEKQQAEAYAAQQRDKAARDKRAADLRDELARRGMLY